MKYFILIFALLMIPPQVTAEELMVGAVTYHFDRDIEYQELNPMVVYTTDSKYSMGVFKNSYNNASAILGKHFAIENGGLEIGVLAGAVYGYEKGQMFELFPCHKKLCAAVLPALSYQVGSWKPTVLFGGTFVSFAVGYKF